MEKKDAKHHQANTFCEMSMGILKLKFLGFYRASHLINTSCRPEKKKKHPRFFFWGVRGGVRLVHVIVEFQISKNLAVMEPTVCHHYL